MPISNNDVFFIANSRCKPLQYSLNMCLTLV